MACRSGRTVRSIPRTRTRTLTSHAPLVAMLVFAGACSEQAFVSYFGTVTEAPAGEPSSASFGFEPPPDAVPIADASVQLCRTTHCQAVTNAEGAFGPVYDSFPLFSARDVALVVAADGYEPYTYRTRYPTGEDPVYGEALLNVRLRRLEALDGGDADSAAPTDGGAPPVPAGP